MCQLSQFLWNLAAQLIVTEPKILQGLQASQLARQLSRKASAYEAKIRHQPLAVAPGEFPVTGFGAICFSEAQVTKHADKHLEKSSRRMAWDSLKAPSGGKSSCLIGTSNLYRPFSSIALVTLAQCHLEFPPNSLAIPAW
jgi:hypothetical protein